MKEYIYSDHDIQNIDLALPDLLFVKVDVKFLLLTQLNVIDGKGRVLMFSGEKII